MAKLNLVSAAFLLPEDIDPLIAIREMVQNAIDGGATCVRIEEHPSGGILIRDNGKGMTPKEMRLYLTGLGSSSSKLGRGAAQRMGIGSKIASALCGPAVFTSHCQRSPENNQAYQIILKATDDGTHFEGLPDTEHGVGKFVSIPRDSLDKRSGTSVHLKSANFSITKIIEFLNQRYLSIPGEVVVTAVDRSSEIRIVGALGSLKALCEVNGTKAYKGTTTCPAFNLHWGIRPQKASRRQSELVSPWSAPPFSFAADGECVEWWDSHRGGIAKVNTAGIYCGQSEVILIIEAVKGFKFDIFRSKITGFDDTVASEIVAEDLPESLHEFLDAYNAMHVDDVIHQDLLDYLIDEFELTLGGGRKKTSEEGDDDEDDGHRGGKGGGKGGKKPPKNPPGTGRKTKTPPKIVFQRDGQENDPIVANPRLITINESYGPVKTIFEECGRSNEKRELAKALLAIEVLSQISRYGALHDGEFPPLPILVNCIEHPSVLLWFTHGRIKLPTQRQITLHRNKKKKGQ